MGYNEFISNWFVAIHIKYALKPYTFGPKFKSQLIFATSAVTGNIDNPMHHNGLAFKSLKMGIWQAGLS